MNPLTIPHIIAILSPFVYAFVNVIDKYIVAHKVKKPHGFAVISGIWVGVFGLIVASLVSWEGIELKSLIYPLITGLIIGPYFFLYYYVMQKEDASHMVGLAYTYPIIVALLSFIFLGEIISWIGYLGMLIALSGVLILSLRLKKIKLKASIFAVLAIILYLGVYEFLVKVIVTNVPMWNGIAVSSIANAFSTSLFLISPKVRGQFTSELKNFKWGLPTEAMGAAGVITVYFAMSYLPATIVSSIGAIQPAAVLFLERIADPIFGKMKRDHLLLPKLFAIILIIIGVVLLSIAGV